MVRALTKVGNNSLVLQAANTYTGSTTVTVGTLTYNGSGSAISSTGFTVNPGATLTLDDQSVANANVLNRLGSAASSNLTLNGGFLNLQGVNLPNVLTNETIGTVTLSTGFSTITTQSGPGTATSSLGTVSLTVGNLVRNTGTSVDFAAGGSTFGNNPTLGTTASDANKIILTNINSAAPALSLQGNGGGILPWAEVTSPGVTPLDFATYGSNGIAAFSNYKTSLAAAGPGDIVKLTSSESLTTNKSIGALLIAGNYTVTQNLFTLTVTTGGIIATGASTGTIGANGNGTLDFGSGAAIATTSLGTGATANQVTNGVVSSGGSGYSAAPVVLLSGGGGSGATATATITGGVGSVFVASGGSGYTSAPTVAFSAPTSGTTATGLAVITAGVVTSVTITNAGSGYTSTPTVTFSAPTSGTTATGTGVLNATVTSVAVTSGGSGYTSAPTVIFEGGGGSAEGIILANVNATINSAITGNEGLTVSGAGTVTLVNDNFYTGTTTFNGATTLNAGTLQVGNTTGQNGVASPLGSGTLTITNGIFGTAVTTGLYVLGNAVNLTPNAVVTLGTSVAGTSFTLSGPMSLSGANQISVGSANSNVFLGGIVSGTGASLNLIGGAGALILNNVNSYTGGTNLAASTLIVTNSSALGAGAVNLTGGTIEDSGTVFNAGVASLTISNPVTLINANATVGGIFGTTLTFSGPVSVAGNTNTLTITHPGMPATSGGAANGLVNPGVFFTGGIGSTAGALARWATRVP